MCEPVIEIDVMANAAYISLNKHTIARTFELTTNISLDLDFNNSLVGIEYLSLEEKFPIESQLLGGIEITALCQRAISDFENS